MKKIISKVLRAKRYIKISCALCAAVLTGIMLDGAFPAFAGGTIPEQSAVTETFVIPSEITMPKTINGKIEYHFNEIQSVFEFWGEDGCFRVCYSDKKNVYIDVFDSDIKKLASLKIIKEMSMVGNITIDRNGYYYIVYGEEIVSDNLSAEVLRIVKYDSNGNYIDKTSVMAEETGLNGYNEYCTKKPFYGGNCETVIDKYGILAIRYARVSFNGHESSHSIYIDTSTMGKIRNITPYASHSFYQRMILTEDDGYLLAESGDAYPRGVLVTKVNRGYYPPSSRWEEKSFIPFHFRTGKDYQYTYAVLAGIAELSNGYALVGASEKTLSCKAAEDYDLNEPRNIFVQIFSKNINSSGTSNPYVQLLKGEERIPVDTSYSENYGCKPEDKDYGVLWLTDYTGNQYASSPKLVKLDSDRLLIMWEEKELNGDYYFEEYKRSLYCIVSGTGEMLQKPTEIGLHLSENGTPTYKDGYIYWVTTPPKAKYTKDCITTPIWWETFRTGDALTTYDGYEAIWQEKPKYVYPDEKSYNIHRLKVGKLEKLSECLCEITADETFYIVLGESKKLPITLHPADSQVQLGYAVEDRKTATVDNSGMVTGLKSGSTGVVVYSKKNDDVYVKIKLVVVCGPLQSFKGSSTAKGEVFLKWGPMHYEDEYIIYRSTSKKGKYKKIYTAWSEDVFWDENLKSGKTYYYKIVTVEHVNGEKIKCPKIVKVKVK